MPKALEIKLRRQVNREHPNWSEARRDAYVYGTLRKTGWVPSTQKKGKLPLQKIAKGRYRFKK